MAIVRCAALAMTLMACQGTGGPAASPANMPGPVMDRLVDVGGLSLHIRCAGAGTPAVVLDAGLGNDGSVWSDVQAEVGRSTRVCAYDRAGTGSSGAAPRPHTSRQMVAELHALLGKAGVTGPYVLAGHSLGGLNVRLYTSEYPEEVSGLVLVDATMEEQDSRLWSLIPEGPMREFRNALSGHPEGLDLEAFRASMAFVRESNRSLGDRPLVVLTHGKALPQPPGISAELGAKMERVWQEMQSDLARLSSNSVHLVAENSGHHIHKQAPRLVIAALQEVVRAARAHARVDASTMSGLVRDGAP